METTAYKRLCFDLVEIAITKASGAKVLRVPVQGNPPEADGLARNI